MEKTYNYVYVTTNIVNNKQYVGDHSSHKINDSYLGSGRYFNKAVKMYGKENFKKQILEYFPTKQEAFDAQEKYIISFNTLVPLGYNLSPTGGVGCMRCFSENTRKLMSYSRTGEKNGMFGKNHTVESKIKLSESRKKGFSNGSIKVTIFSTEVKLRLSNSGKNKNNSKDNNPMFGKPHSIESKIKMSNTKKGKPSHRKGTHLSDETKLKITETRKQNKLKKEGLLK